MNVEQAKKLVWDEILIEDEENFTPEFRAKVIEVIKKIMGDN